MSGGKIMERMFTMEVDEFNEVFKGNTGKTIQQDFHNLNIVNKELAMRS